MSRRGRCRPSSLYPRLQEAKMGDEGKKSGGTTAQAVGIAATVYLGRSDAADRSGAVAVSSGRPQVDGGYQPGTAPNAPLPPTFVPNQPTSVQPPPKK